MNMEDAYMCQPALLQLDHSMLAAAASAVLDAGLIACESAYGTATEDSHAQDEAAEALHSGSFHGGGEPNDPASGKLVKSADSHVHYFSVGCGPSP